jgi:branched-chain amino acid transport system substrate-binding protein
MPALALGIALSMSLLATASAESVKIGVIAPLSGGGAPWGKASQAALDIAASEVNAKGGLDVDGKKYQVEVIAYDDQYKAADAVAAYNRLVTKDGVKYMFIVLSPETLALAQSVEDDKVIALSAAGVERAVNPASKYMFRVLSIYRDYVPLVIGWVKDHRPGRRVALIGPNDEVGWSYRDFVSPVYKTDGFDLVDSELFERSLRDFAPVLTKIIAMAPDMIDISAVPPATAGLIVRQARDLGYKGIFVKASGAATKEIIEAAGKDGAEGTISLHFTDPHTDGYKRLAAEYQKSVGGQPDDLIVIQYDAARALLTAIKNSGDVNDTAKVSAALLTRTFPMESALGDKLDLGGKAGRGSPNQIMTVGYISVIENGDPVIVGKVQ